MGVSSSTLIEKVISDTMSRKSSILPANPTPPVLVRMRKPIHTRKDEESTGVAGKQSSSTILTEGRKKP